MIVTVAAPTNAVLMGYPSSSSTAGIERQVSILGGGQQPQAVLRALARSQRGRPTPQIQRVLRDALSPLGVRLSPAVLQELAAGIAAGRPVELP